jgi:protein-L-isoaspartate(D-aspartate) O-methyltransferase
MDRHRRLVKAAREVFEAENISNIIAFTADGSRGLPEQAPFDRIVLTAASEDPPGPLLAQLRIGGIMVLPVGQSDAVQTLVKVTKTDEGLNYQELRAVRFVPLLEGLGKENT